MAGAPLELLPDCASLARWLKAAGLLSKREGKRLERKWSARPAFAGMVRELREFREELRQTVLEMEAGAPRTGVIFNLLAAAAMPANDWRGGTDQATGAAAVEDL